MPLAAWRSLALRREREAASGILCWRWPQTLVGCAASLLFFSIKGERSMRQLFAVTVILLVVGQFQAATDDAAKVKVEGVHLCCGACAKAVTEVLKDAKVDKVNVDRPNKTVTFEAMPADAEKAIKALYDAGFAGKATIGAKAFEVKAKAPDLQADAIVVKNVHVCCGQCTAGIKALFKDMNGVTVDVPKEKAVRKDITVSGKGLTAEQVLKTLNDGGFNGVIEAKK
jgi:periplasmic mercuric ion binding protein